MNLLQHTLLGTLTATPLIAPALYEQPDQDLGKEGFTGSASLEVTLEEAGIAGYDNEGVRLIQRALGAQWELSDLTRRVEGGFQVKAEVQLIGRVKVDFNGTADSSDQLLKVASDAIMMATHVEDAKERTLIAFRNGKVVTIKELEVVIPPSFDQLMQSNPSLMDRCHEVTELLQNAIVHMAIEASQSTDPDSLNRLNELKFIAEQLAGVRESLDELDRAFSRSSLDLEEIPDSKDYSTKIGPKGSIVARIYREDPLTKERIPVDPKVDLSLPDRSPSLIQLNTVTSQMDKVLRSLIALFPKKTFDNLLTHEVNYGTDSK